MKNLITILCLLVCLPAFGKRTKKIKKKEEQVLNFEQLQKDIQFLASDSLEGRRTGTIGEEIAANYIANRFLEMGVAPFFENDYIQSFSINEGKMLSENNSLTVFDKPLNKDEYAPLPFSANANALTLIMNKIAEKGNGVFLYASKICKDQLNNPHASVIDTYFVAAKKAIDKGATAVYFCNDLDSTYNYTFSSKKFDKTLAKPVVFINNTAYKKYIKANAKKEWIDLAVEVDIQDKIRDGKNVAAFINNGGTNTVVLGAHFDHLGYGEDHNSTYTGKDLQIHNGADDNASGTAAILDLAKKIKNTKGLKNNYILVTFSGEELGLYGSKKFIEQNTDKLQYVNYMLNIDMLGRYDNEKKSITIGGVGTSPSWIPTITKSKPFFTPKWDSAGIGPSDHTSFYLKDIPVLFFFTGLHTDYHKPSDDADKINYEGEAKLVNYIFELITQVDKQKKLVFSKTKEPKMGTSSFKVSLGIMPDYTFSGNGVKADGIIAGKAAEKATMQAGDIILQIGTFKTADIQAYMEALSKFKKGDTTTIKVLRGTKTIDLELTFL